MMNYYYSVSRNSHFILNSPQTQDDDFNSVEHIYISIPKQYLASVYVFEKIASHTDAHA